MKSVSISNKDTSKKTSLDNYQLFYEEVPLEVDQATKNAIRSRSNRLVRRSKVSR